MAETKGIKIKFEADASPVKSALSQVEKASRTLTKQLKDIDKLLELDPTNITLLAQKQDILQKSVANTTAQLKGMEAAQEDITKGYAKWQQNQQAIEKNNTTIAKLTEELSQAQTEMTSMWSAVGEGSASVEQYEAAAQKVAALTKNIEKLRQEQKALSKDPTAINEETYQRYITDTERLRLNLQQLGTMQAQVNAEIADGGRSAQEAARAEQEAARAAEEQAKAEEERKRAAEQAAQADERAKKAAQEYKSALDKLKNAANNVKNDIKGMATAVSTGIAAIGSAVAAGTAATTKVGMEFSKSMSNVQALSGATADELEALKNAAAEAGANTSKSASQAADALGYMALAGWDTEQMLAGLMPVLRASEAGAMDLAACSDLVTDSMSSMGIAVGDLQHYLDICTKTQSSANTSMEQLLQAYVVCGGMLKNLNVPLEESAALLGTLANRGIKGAEAGTALNSILVNLIGANKNAASAMKDMGISAFDAEGRFIGLEKTLTLVKSKLDEYGDNTEKITQLEAKLGGKTQLDTLQALLSGVNEEYGSLNATLQECNGSLEATARTMQDNLSGDNVSLKSALEGVENTIYDSLEAPFRSAAQNVTKELRDLNQACTEGELADSISKTAASLSKLISEAAKFAADDAFPTLIKWLDWVATNADAIISAITGMGAAWGLWKIGQYATHLQKLVEAIKLVKTASVAAAAAQNGLTTSAASAAASEEALAAATSMTAAAFLALEVAIGAVLIALAAFAAKQIDAAAEELRNKNALDETTQALYDQAKAYKESAATAEENCKKADENADAAKKYWEQIKSLVDENGRATGSTEELKKAVARLNEVSGSNIEVVNGQIQGYETLITTMDDYIENMRREAKMSYMKEGYGEAVANIDKVTEQYKAAYEERIAAATDFESKRLRYLNSDKSNTKEERKRFKEEMEAANDRLAAAQVQESSLKSLMDSYQSTMDEYESMLEADLPANKTKEEAMREAATIDAKALEEQNRKNAELAKLGVKQTWEELEASLADLDGQLSIHSITEEDYWAERRRILEDSQYKESADWWEYYDKVTDYYDKLSEKEQKAQEDAIKTQKENDKKSLEDKIDALKLKAETDKSYTKEMLYNEMEILISGLDKQDDAYKKYNAEIIKGRKALADETSKTLKEGLKTDVTEIENQIKQVSSEYQTSVKKLLSDKQTYFNKLFDTSDFTSRSKQTVNGKEADVFSLSDPKEALKKLEAYDRALNKLEGRNVSQNVLDWIDTLDTQTAKDTIDVLNKMSDKQLQSYSNNFDKLKNKAAEMSASKYDPQIEALNKDFIDRVNALLETLPGAAENTGVQTAQGFISGLLGSNGDISSAVSEFTSTILDQIKADLDINSPSKETEELGEYTAKGFLEGLTSQSMGEAAENIASSFITKLAEKDPEIRAAMEETFVGNISEVLGSMESLTTASLSRIAASISGKIPALPDITKLSLPSTNAVNNASNTSGIEEISAKLDKLDKLDSVIQAISILSSSGQTVKLQLEIDGQLVADMDNITAVISKKFNNLSIQTGRQVFSY